ncbi:DDE-type integrase/transposase/recombinase [Chitinophaga rhizophila]|uniref:DDE-type integrase/transposase/recombinase n=1 Tax=Chitinophaga rhizophila TaxID=2866212 RepID=UPI003742AD04
MSYVEADFSMSAENVVRILDRIASKRGKPNTIRVDNGPEYISKAFVGWHNKEGISYAQIGRYETKERTT